MLKILARGKIEITIIGIGAKYDPKIKDNAKTKNAFKSLRRHMVKSKNGYLNILA